MIFCLMGDLIVFVSFWTMWALISYFIVQIYSESRIQEENRNKLLEILASIGFGLLVNLILFIVY